MGNPKLNMEVSPGDVLQKTPVMMACAANAAQQMPRRLVVAVGHCGDYVDVLVLLVPDDCLDGGLGYKRDN